MGYEDGSEVSEVHRCREGLCREGTKSGVKGNQGEGSGEESEAHVGGRDGLSISRCGSSSWF